MIWRFAIVFLVICGLYAGFEITRFSWMYYSVRNPAAEFQVRPAEGKQALTFVEFIDYNCPDCKKLHPAVTDFLAIRKDVRYVARPVVVLHEGASRKLARLALAAGIQGKFFELHDAFLGYPPDQEVNDAFIKQTADLYDIDYDKLVADSAGKQVDKWMRENNDAAVTGGVFSTPTLFMGRTVVEQTGKTLTVQDLQRLSKGSNVE